MAEFWKMLGNLWLPLAIFGSVFIVVRNANSLALAFKNAPIIRGLKIHGVEISINTKELDALEARENDTFRHLSSEIEKSATKSARALDIDSHLRDVSNSIMRLAKKFDDTDPSPVRFTIHTRDVIFKNHLYQLTDYFTFRKGQTSRDRGRRFSTRYGIIGLAWRSQRSQGTGNAFQGDETEIENLKIRWSMTDEEAERARKRPSCLAIALKSDSPANIVGILYCDSTEPNFWGKDDEAATEFARRCESVGEVKNLIKALREFSSFSEGLRIDLDLTSLN